MYERNYYTFMTLIGDVGGFNGAIILFPAFIMSFYSSHMFSSSLYSKFPVKRKKLTNSKNQNALQRKLIATGQQLNKEDIQILKSEIDR